jgi:hypothetical protein
VVQPVRLLARRTLAGGVREDLQVLIVGDPQVDEPEAAVVVVEAEQLGEAELAGVEVEGPVDVPHADGDVAQAGDAAHRTFPSRRGSCLAASVGGRCCRAA